MEPLFNHLLSKRRMPHVLFSWCQEQCSVVPQQEVAAPGDALATSAPSETAAGLVGRDMRNGAPPTVKPLILKELRAVWKRWPCWDASCTVLLDDDPIKAQRNPAFTTLTPTKWRALSPPSGSAAELAPNSQLYTYLDQLRCAPDTRAFMEAYPYQPK